MWVCYCSLCGSEGNNTSDMRHFAKEMKRNVINHHTFKMKRLVWNHESYYWYETNCLQPSHTLQVKQNVLKLTTYFWGETICFKLNQILLRWNKLSETIIRLRWNGMYFGGETKCHKPLYFWDETKCFQSHHHAFEMKGNVLNQTTMSLR